MRSQERLRRFAVVLVLFCAFAQAENLYFDFQNGGGDKGWNKTKTTRTESSTNALVLRGDGWDSKIYRSISLNPGHYVLSASGRGTLSVLLQKSWADKPIVNLNLTRETWRKDWRPFDVEGGDAMLVVYVGSSTNVTGEIQWIKIDAVVVTADKDIPNITLLEKNRPSPEIVRGMVIGGTSNESDWADLKKTGANVARYFLEPARKMKALGKTNLFDVWPLVMDDFEIRAKLARQNGIKLVPVLNGSLLGPKAKLNHGEYWEDSNLEAVMCRMWREFVVRFSSYRDVIWALDLFNEALDWEQMPYAPRQWRDIATGIVKTIRRFDPDVWLIYQSGPGGNNWGFSGMKPLPDTRIIYSAHFYLPYEFTCQGLNNIEGTDLAEAMKKINVRYPSEINGLFWDKKQIEVELAKMVEFQKKYRVPIFLGEFSVIRWAPKEDAVRYLTDVSELAEKYGWSWCYHAFREFNAWSFEHDEQPWLPKMPLPDKVGYETERAKVIKAALRKNVTSPQ